MDRAEFLNRLEAQLLDVPQAEREEALQYYEDYLNDAGDAGDFDILQELGTPEEVADSIRNGLRQDSSDASERSGQADENWQDSSRSGQAGVFSFVITWADSGNPIYVGLFDAGNGETYVIPLEGGTGAFDADLSPVPSGSYYVIVLHQGKYEADITGSVSYCFK